MRWRIVDTDSGAGTWSDDPAGTTVGTDANAKQALTVPGSGPDSVDQNNDGFLAMGTEWSAVVEWTDAQGDHRASLPPPTPGSLSRLEQLVQNTLGLPDDALTFGLNTSGPAPMLTIGLGYGICSSTAPTGLEDDCEDMPTGPTPSTNINFSIGDDSFAALEVTGEPTVRYAAIGAFNLGVPLNGDEPEILADTTLKLNALLDTSNIGLKANLGPFAALAGAAIPAMSGTALTGSTTDTLVVTGTLAGQIPVGARIERTSGGAGECVVTVKGVADADNNVPLTCAGVTWSPNDGFSVLHGGELKGQLGLEVALTPGRISTTAPTFAITGLQPANDCGPLPGGTSTPGVAAGW